MGGIGEGNGSHLVRWKVVSRLLDQGLAECLWRFNHEADTLWCKVLCAVGFAWKS